MPGATVADAVAEGYALNLPLRVTGDGPASAAVPPPLVSCDSAAVVVEAVKLADDRSGDVVVRLYESLGGRAEAVLRTGFPLVTAAVVDLLERQTPDPAWSWMPGAPYGCRCARSRSLPCGSDPDEPRPSRHHRRHRRHSRRPGRR
ncbi:glycosyl hydrolase-related protein [Phytohabitans flavus]|uniref:glycosyl hydrolase-related protein n=1 Tax=Phytohabitans flavus TaxID=1076124 RepID=UPI003631320F